MKLGLALTAVALLATAPLVIVFARPEPDAPAARRTPETRARRTELARSYRATTPGERAAHLDELRRRMLPRIAGVGAHGEAREVWELPILLHLEDFSGSWLAEPVHVLGGVAGESRDAL